MLNISTLFLVCSGLGKNIDFFKLIFLTNYSLNSLSTYFTRDILVLMIINQVFFHWKHSNSCIKLIQCMESQTIHFHTSNTDRKWGKLNQTSSRSVGLAMVPCHHITRLMFITEHIPITSVMRMKSTCQSNPGTGLSCSWPYTWVG